MDELLPVLIVIALVIAVIYFGIVYWYVSIPLVTIGALLYSKIKKQKAAAQRKAEKEAELERLKQQQEAYRQQMMVLGDQSMALFESIPEHLRTAEDHLDQAEIDFAEGVFAPFWDSIEKAALTLGRFDEGVRKINDCSSRYVELNKQYKADPPRFPLSPPSVTKLTVGTATAERMKRIVRTAQRNYQFASIYEQRKTNQILVAGFTSLAQALDEMTWRITASIDGLASSVDSMGSTLNESILSIHSRIGDIAEMTAKHNQAVSKESSEGQPAKGRLSRCWTIYSTAEGHPRKVHCVSLENKRENWVKPPTFSDSQSFALLGCGADPIRGTNSVIA